MKFKIDETGLATTPACYRISKTIKLSHMTLLRAYNGVFSMKTVHRMIEAGWFSMSEYHASTKPTETQQKAQPTTQKPQLNMTEFESKFKALIQEAFDKGYQNGVEVSKKQANTWYQEGYKKGQETGRSGISSSYKERQEAFNNGKKEGFDKGRQTGHQEGYSQGYQAGIKAGRFTRTTRTTIQTLSINTEKLRGVFELSKRGATDGEKIAARRAAGIMLSKWILNEFGDSVQVNLIGE